MLYKKNYCDLVIKERTEGRTMAEVAAKIGVDYATLAVWRNNYPDFDKACAVAETAAEAWWARLAQEACFNKDANAKLICFNLSARHNWSSKTEQKIEGTIKHEEAIKMLE